MTEERRRRLLLAVLLVAAAVFMLTRLPGLLERAGGIAGPGAGGGPGVGEARVAELDVHRLTAAPRNYAPGRDPFRYYEPPPPPPPAPPPAPPGPTEEELRAMEEARRLAAEQALAARGPALPSIELEYLGSFGPPDLRIAVFADGEQIYNAVVGEVLQGKFVVAQIGYESVDLAYVEFPEEPPARLAVGG